MAAFGLVTREEFAAATRDIGVLRTQINDLLAGLGTLADQNEALIQLLRRSFDDAARTDILFKHLQQGHSPRIAELLIASIKKDCRDFRTAIDIAEILNNTLEADKTKIRLSVEKTIPRSKLKCKKALESITKYRTAVEAEIASNAMDPGLAAKYKSEMERASSIITMLESQLDSVYSQLKSIANSISQIELKQNPSEDIKKINQASSMAKAGSESEAYNSIVTVGAEIPKYRSFSDHVHSELAMIKGVATVLLDQASQIGRHLIATRSDIAQVAVALKHDKINHGDSKRIIKSFAEELERLNAKLLELQGRYGEIKGRSFLEQGERQASGIILSRMENMLKEIERMLRARQIDEPVVKNRIHVLLLNSNLSHEDIKKCSNLQVMSDAYLSHIATVIQIIKGQITLVRDGLKKRFTTEEDRQNAATFFNLIAFKNATQYYQQIRQYMQDSARMINEI